MKHVFGEQTGMCVVYGTKCDMDYLECVKSVLETIREKESFLISIRKYFGNKKEADYGVFQKCIQNHAEGGQE